MLFQDITVLIKISSHCKIHALESVPVQWAILFQLCRGLSQCLSGLALAMCKTHCSKQKNSKTQGGKKKGAKIFFPTPKQKKGRTVLMISQADEGGERWQIV